MRIRTGRPVSEGSFLEKIKSGKMLSAAAGLLRSEFCHWPEYENVKNASVSEILVNDISVFCAVARSESTAASLSLVNAISTNVADPDGAAGSHSIFFVS